MIRVLELYPPHGGEGRSQMSAAITLNGTSKRGIDLPARAQTMVLGCMSNSVSLLTVLVSATVSAATGYISSRLSQRLQDREAAYRWRLAILSETRPLRTRLAP